MHEQMGLIQIDRFVLLIDDKTLLRPGNAAVVAVVERIVVECIRLTVSARHKSRPEPAALRQTDSGKTVPASVLKRISLCCRSGERLLLHAFPVRPKPPKVPKVKFFCLYGRRIRRCSKDLHRRRRKRCRHECCAAYRKQFFHLHHLSMTNSWIMGVYR